MDTIDADLLRRVAGVLERDYAGMVMHTVSFTLNGAHGGLDVRFQGFYGVNLDAAIDDVRIFGCASIPDGTSYDEAMR